MLQNQLCVFMTRSTKNQCDRNDQWEVVQKITGGDRKHFVLPAIRLEDEGRLRNGMNEFSMPLLFQCPYPLRYLRHQTLSSDR